MPYDWADMVLYFFIYSFVGWAQETVQCSVRERRFVNRGFLNGPICPIYGCGALLILTALLPLQRGISSLWLAVPLVFLIGGFIASALEYFTSWLMEKLFHARWWDYSQQKCNLNGRICLWISIAWGVLAAALVFLIQPLFARGIDWLYGIWSFLPMLTALVLGTVMVVDCVFSVKAALSIGDRLEKLEKVGETIKEHLENIELPTEDFLLRLENVYDRLTEKNRERSTERQTKLKMWKDLTLEEKRTYIADKVKALQAKQEELFRPKFQQRRLLNAFPKLHQTGEKLDSNRNRLLQELRDRIRR
jgi:uncharacterized membrane protein